MGPKDLSSSFRIRLLIAGGRNVRVGPDKLDKEVLDFLLVDSGSKGVCVISGGAPGVDRSADLWARSRGLPSFVFPADWDRHGKAAGKMRNQEMEREATHLLAFWDGMSPGTAHMIATMTMRGKPVRVVHVA